MLNVNFNGYGKYVTDQLYQWDKNRVLSITGLDLDVVPEIHFTNVTMDKAIVRQSTVTDGVIKADIPNSLLQAPFAIIAYVGVYEGTLFKTIETIKIPVITRARPADYTIENTDGEIYSFVALENQIANMITYEKFNATVADLKNTDESNKVGLSSQIKQVDDALKAQIANIVAHNNDTEGNTELLDIRTGADGTVYDSAGEAVRTQIENVDVTKKVLRAGKFYELSFGKTVEDVEILSTDVNTDEFNLRHITCSLSGKCASAYWTRIATADEAPSIKRIIVKVRNNLDSDTFIGVGTAFNWNSMTQKMIGKTDDFAYYYFSPFDITKNVNLFIGNKSSVDLDAEYQYFIEWNNDVYLHSEKSDHAYEADYAEIAKKSGFEYRNDYVYSMVYLSTDSIKRNENDVTFNISQVNTDTPNMSNRVWQYGYITYDIKDMIGKGVILKIDIFESNKSDNPKVKLNKIVLSNTKDWSSVIRDFSGTSITIDLDNLDVDLSTKENVYLVIGYNESIYANDAGMYIGKESNDITVQYKVITKDNQVLATELIGFNPDDHYTKKEIDDLMTEDKYITCWGDSLTAGGGWTSRLQTLSGLKVYNGGTGGESVTTIIARQGANVMIVNNLTIPADTTPITICKYTDGGILTEFGNKVAPLLQGGAHVNPCYIGDVKGTLKWTGSSYSDTTGTWTFTRAEAGDEVIIDRPTAIRTDFDINKNAPYLMIIFIGQNGGYDDLDDLVNKHRLMIDHANAQHVIVLGLSSGTKEGRGEYETRMRKEFGRYFISLREYLASPLYDADGNIISCYGLDDAGLEPGKVTYNGVEYVALDEIAIGQVPHQLLTDTVHYTSACKTVIGNLIYKRCKELNIF